MTTPFLVDGDLTPSTDDLIAYATALVQVSCEWHIFPSVDATQNVDVINGRPFCPGSISDTCGPKRLYLWTLQLTAVASATLPDGTEFTADDLVFDSVGWVERADGLGWPSAGTIVFAFTHGYDTLPPAVKAVTVSIAKRLPSSMTLWTNRKLGTATLGVAPRIGLPPGSFSVAEDLVLQRYRLPMTRA